MSIAFKIEESGLDYNNSFVNMPVSFLLAPQNLEKILVARNLRTLDITQFYLHSNGF